MLLLESEWVGRVGIAVGDVPGGTGWKLPPKICKLLFKSGISNPKQKYKYKYII